MPRAVKFDKYGGLDVLRVVEVDRPVPGSKEVLIRMKAAGINPGWAGSAKKAYIKIRVIEFAASDMSAIPQPLIHCRV